MVRGAIEKAMEAIIKALDWMTPTTKEQALIKLHAVANKIGTKEHWLDYSKVKIARDDAYGNTERTDKRIRGGPAARQDRRAGRQDRNGR